MKSQENLVERRERARVEVMVQLEDITYRTLRKFGVHGDTRQPQSFFVLDKGAA